MNEVEGHDEVHSKSKWPYDLALHKNDKGENVLLVYVDLDADGNVVEDRFGYGAPDVAETVEREAEPDCTPEDWRVVWAGRTVA